MRTLFAALVALHGAIHLLGFAKAFRPGAVPRLQQAISRPLGVIWLAAALGFVVAAASLLAARRWWWAAAAPALVLSQIAIAAAWGDAKLGTIANAVILVPLALALADLRPSSLRSSYDREVAQAVARAQPAPPVTDADLARLPAPVQAYLRRVGVVGKPRVRSFRARFDAAMRSARDARWMAATVEQHNFYDGDQPSRLFFMQASRLGIPFDVFHRYVGDGASMRVRVAGLIPVVDAAGLEMTRSETVTLLNDMCFLAPGALIDAPIAWRTISAREVEATYANAGHTVRAVLSFDEQGDLVGFVSGDRYQIDARTTRLFPWSTPVTEYRDVGGYHLPAVAEARWREPAGEWTYGRFVLREIAYNVGPPP